jgi:carboxylesterase
MQPFGEELTRHGITCLLPRLSGHENLPDSLNNVKYGDWFRDAENSFQELRNQVENVIVAGHSLGGTLALYLAEQHGKEDGVLAAGLINPAVRLTPQENRAITFGRFYEKRLKSSSKPFQVLRSTINTVRSGLKNIKVPVLMFISDKDELLPFNYQEWLFEGINTTKYFITLPGEGHSPSPEAAKLVINSFLVLVDAFL